jgi:hypothetical protein
MGEYALVLKPKQLLKLLTLAFSKNGGYAFPISVSIALAPTRFVSGEQEVQPQLVLGKMQLVLVQLAIDLYMGMGITLLIR